MTVESQKYAFEDGTNNRHKSVKINLGRFVRQMKEVAGKTRDEKCQRSTVEDGSLPSSSSNTNVQPSKRQKSNGGTKNQL
ncbi:unnamed protein product [Rotaria magnacalcarata]|uniref:Uncharacterized protein n=1 Tax=Rotaria magnacalcarata TaxID=392030 RepID=A0A819DZ36_9BILA|nr:unnamed protein product [Rotaria magnacalcarata]CAF3841451.1 unnamed protein product [Rotaria magnacalcarata]